MVTREGHSARIICWDAMGEKPIIALRLWYAVDRFWNVHEGEASASYYLDGRVRRHKDSLLDLMMVVDENDNYVF